MTSAISTVFVCYFQVQTRVVKELPDILVFNCHLENERDINFWKTQETVSKKCNLLSN